MVRSLHELLNGGKSVKWILDLPYYDDNLTLKYNRCNILHIEIYNVNNKTFLIVSFESKISLVRVNNTYINAGNAGYIIQKICNNFPRRYDLNPEIFDNKNFTFMENSVFTDGGKTSLAFRLENELAEILNPFYIWATHENNNNTSSLPKI